MTYEFHPDAEAEFLESVGFYESRVTGLGQAFIEELESAVKLVCGDKIGKIDAHNASAYAVCLTQHLGKLS